MANSQFIKVSVSPDNSITSSQISLPLGATNAVSIELRVQAVEIGGFTYGPTSAKVFYQIEGIQPSEIGIKPQLLTLSEVDGAEYVFTATALESVLRSAGGKALYLQFETQTVDGIILNSSDFLSFSVRANTNISNVVIGRTEAEVLKAEVNILKSYVPQEASVGNADNDNFVLKDFSKLDRVLTPESTDLMAIYDGTLKSITLGEIIAKGSSDYDAIYDTEDQIPAVLPDIDQRIAIIDFPGKTPEEDGLAAIYVRVSTDPNVPEYNDWIITPERVTVSTDALLKAIQAVEADVAILKDDVNKLNEKTAKIEYIADNGNGNDTYNFTSNTVNVNRLEGSSAEIMGPILANSVVVAGKDLYTDLIDLEQEYVRFKDGDNTTTIPALTNKNSDQDTAIVANADTISDVSDVANRADALAERLDTEALKIASLLNSNSASTSTVTTYDANTMNNRFATNTQLSTKNDIFTVENDGVSIGSNPTQLNFTDGLIVEVINNSINIRNSGGSGGSVNSDRVIMTTSSELVLTQADGEVSFPLKVTIQSNNVDMIEGLDGEVTVKVPGSEWGVTGNILMQAGNIPGGTDAVQLIKRWYVNGVLFKTLNNSIPESTTDATSVTNFVKTTGNAGDIITLTIEVVSDGTLTIPVNDTTAIRFNYSESGGLVDLTNYMTITNYAGYVLNSAGISILGSDNGIVRNALFEWGSSLYDYLKDQDNANVNAADTVQKAILILESKLGDSVKFVDKDGNRLDSIALVFDEIWSNIKTLDLAVSTLDLEKIDRKSNRLTKLWDTQFTLNSDKDHLLIQGPNGTYRTEIVNKESFEPSYELLVVSDKVYNAPANTAGITPIIFDGIKGDNPAFAFAQPTYGISMTPGYQHVDNYQLEVFVKDSSTAPIDVDGSLVGFTIILTLNGTELPGTEQKLALGANYITLNDYTLVDGDVIAAAMKWNTTENYVIDFNDECHFKVEGRNHSGFTIPGDMIESHNDFTRVFELVLVSVGPSLNYDVVDQAAFDTALEKGEVIIKMPDVTQSHSHTFNIKYKDDYLFVRFSADPNGDTESADPNEFSEQFIQISLFSEFIIDIVSHHAHIADNALLLNDKTDNVNAIGNTIATRDIAGILKGLTGDGANDLVNLEKLFDIFKEYGIVREGFSNIDYGIFASGNIYDMRSAFQLSNGNIFSVGDYGRWDLTNDSGAPLSNGIFASGTSYDMRSAFQLSNGNIFSVGEDGRWNLTNDSGAPLSNGIFASGTSYDMNSTIQLSNGNIFTVGNTGRWNLTTETGSTISNGIFTGSATFVKTTIQLSNGNIFSAGNGGRWNLSNDDGSAISNGRFTGQTTDVNSVIQLSNGNIFGVGYKGNWDIITEDGTQISNGTLSAQTVYANSAIRLPNGEIFVTGDDSFWDIINEDGTSVLYGTLAGQTADTNSVIQLSNGGIFIVGDNGTWNLNKHISLPSFGSSNPLPDNSNTVLPEQSSKLAISDGVDGITFDYNDITKQGSMSHISLKFESKDFAGDLNNPIFQIPVGYEPIFMESLDGVHIHEDGGVYYDKMSDGGHTFRITYKSQ